MSSRIYSTSPLKSVQHPSPIIEYKTICYNQLEKFVKHLGESKLYQSLENFYSCLMYLKYMYLNKKNDTSIDLNIFFDNIILKIDNNDSLKFLSSDLANFTKNLFEQKSGLFSSNKTEEVDKIIDLIKKNIKINDEYHLNEVHFKNFFQDKKAIKDILLIIINNVGKNLSYGVLKIFQSFCSETDLDILKNKDLIEIQDVENFIFYMVEKFELSNQFHALAIQKMSSGILFSKDRPAPKKILDFCQKEKNYLFIDSILCQVNGLFGESEAQIAKNFLEQNDKKINLNEKTINSLILNLKAGRYSEGGEYATFPNNLNTIYQLLLKLEWLDSGNIGIIIGLLNDTDISIFNNEFKNNLFKSIFFDKIIFEKNNNAIFLYLFSCKNLGFELNPEFITYFEKNITKYDKEIQLILATYFFALSEESQLDFYAKLKKSNFIFSIDKNQFQSFLLKFFQKIHNLNFILSMVYSLINFFSLTEETNLILMQNLILMFEKKIHDNDKALILSCIARIFYKSIETENIQLFSFLDNLKGDFFSIFFSRLFEENPSLGFKYISKNPEKILLNPEIDKTIKSFLIYNNQWKKKFVENNLENKKYFEDLCNYNEYLRENSSINNIEKYIDNLEILEKDSYLLGGKIIETYNSFFIHSSSNKRTFIIYFDDKNFSNELKNHNYYDFFDNVYLKERILNLVKIDEIIEKEGVWQNSSMSVIDKNIENHMPLFLKNIIFEHKKNRMNFNYLLSVSLQEYILNKINSSDINFDSLTTNPEKVKEIIKKVCLRLNAFFINDNGNLSLELSEKKEIETTINFIFANFFQDRNTKKGLSDEFKNSVLQPLVEDTPQKIFYIAYQFSLLASSYGGLGWHSNTENVSNTYIRLLSGKLFEHFINVCKERNLNICTQENLSTLTEQKNKILHSSECLAGIASYIKSSSFFKTIVGSIAL